jgi:hypothetical protein
MIEAIFTVVPLAGALVSGQEFAVGMNVPEYPPVW